MIAYSPQMFPNTVSVRKCSYLTGAQGGVGPTPGVGTVYAASVQDMGVRAQDDGPMPQSVTRIRLYIPQAVGDLLIPALLYGDEFTWIDGGDRVLTILGPARNRGGYGIVWRLDCELVV